jgi:hypothetical protein
MRRRSVGAAPARAVSRSARPERARFRSGVRIMRFIDVMTPLASRRDDSFRRRGGPGLRTLGGLSLAAPSGVGLVTRPKPLLLLAYLAHEGPTDRDRLARLFFDTSRDARDALSTTLRRLGVLVARPRAGDRRIGTTVGTDAIAFQELVLTADPRVALASYGGPFCGGVDLRLGLELEEWLSSTRERLASHAGICS